MDLTSTHSPGTFGINATLGGKTDLTYRTPVRAAINMKILFIALSRSGHHAIINWYINQLKGDSVHYNDCSTGKTIKDFLPSNNRKILYTAGTKEDTRDDLINPNRFQNHIYSLENFDISNFRPEGLHKVGFDTVVLVLRDFYNWTTSRVLADKKDHLEDYPRERLLWEKYAKEFLGRTNELNAPKTFISYNDWFSCEEYRRAICHRVGGSYNEAGLKEVVPFGGGSSFDGWSYSGQANKMKTLDRYKLIKKENLINLSSRETDNLNKRIFNLSLF